MLIQRESKFKIEIVLFERNFKRKTKRINSPTGCSHSISLVLCIKMAGRNSIKLFEFSRNYCEAVGIKLSHSTENRHKLNLVNLIFVISLVVNWTTTLAYTLWDAEHMSEYGMGMVILSCDSTVIFVYLIIIWQSEDILKFIEMCERFIEQSKR